MTRMLQVRNLPDNVHSELVRRAKNEGVSLSDYVRAILEREVERMPKDVWLKRIRERGPIDLRMSGAQAVQEARDERDREQNEWFDSRFPDP